MSSLPLNQVLCGEVRQVLRGFPDESINLIVTSPPYWGLRDYGREAETVWGGSEGCEHEWVEEGSGLVHENRNNLRGSQEEALGKTRTAWIRKYDSLTAGTCSKCGAWHGQLGLEPHPKMYIDHLVEVCRELKRVLRKDGSFYLNLGDTYYGSGCGFGSKPSNQFGMGEMYNTVKKPQSGGKKSNWLQPKQLLGIPWRTIIALQEDGWLLRNAIVWHKPNHMPSSVRDRLTSSYELMFYLVKSRRYWYDLDAVRQPHTSLKDLGRKRRDTTTPKGDYAKSLGQNTSPSGYLVQHPLGKNPGDVLEYRCENPRKIDETAKFFRDKGSGGNLNLPAPEHPLGKNPGDVLEYDSKYSETSYGQTLQGFIRNQRIAKARQKSRKDAKQLFPNDKEKQQEYINLIHDHSGHPMGKNPGDVIQARVVKKGLPNRHHGSGPSDIGKQMRPYPLGKNPSDFWSVNTHPFKGAHFAVFPEKLVEPIIKSSCPEEGVVLDPLCGSGTTCLVAKKLQRNYIGIDIKSEYCEIARKRLGESLEVLGET